MTPWQTFYAAAMWTLGFWAWGANYTIVKNRHIGLDIGTGRRAIDVPALWGGRVIIVWKTGTMGWVVVLDTGLPGARRYHAYCHLSAVNLPRAGAWINRGERVAKLAAGARSYGDPEYGGTLWGGIHLHLVMSNIAHAAYTRGTGATFANPEDFIREQLAAAPAGGGAVPFDPKGFLMALTDTQQRQIYEALVVGGESASAYYMPQAIVNVLRGEITSAIASIAAGNIAYPGATYNGLVAIVNAIREGNGEAPIDVDEGELAAKLAPALAPLIADNLGTLSDATVDELVKRLLDEQSRRLAE